MSAGTAKRAAILAALGLLLAGCEAATNAANRASELADEAAERIQETSHDASISLKVKDALIKDDDVRAAKIRVSTANGVVTLRGSQPSAERRSRAEAAARRTPGVVDVVNEIEIVP